MFSMFFKYLSRSTVKIVSENLSSYYFTLKSMRRIIHDYWDNLVIAVRTAFAVAHHHLKINLVLASIIDFKN